MILKIALKEYKIKDMTKDLRHSKNTVEWLIFPCNNFPNFSFFGVSFSNFSEERT